jgi:uncharacterized surface protein with fasciclin (FAS1) repeats
MMKSLRTMLLGAVAAAGLTVTAVAAHAATVADVLATDPRFAHLTELIQKAGLKPELRSASLVTVRAPTNDAFNRMPASVVQQLAPTGANQDRAANQPELQSLVRIHMLANAYPGSTFVGQRTQVIDQAGTSLIIDGTQAGMITITTVPHGAGGPDTGGLTTTRRAAVSGTALVADNGVIYPIDNVLAE